MNTETQSHPFSWRGLSRIVVMGLGLFLAFRALDALVEIVIALVLASSLYPIVKSLHFRFHISLFFATLVVFLLLPIPFIFLGYAILPSLTTQSPLLITSINSTVRRLPFFSDSLQNFNIVGYVQSHSSFLLTSSGNIFLSIISVFTVFILTFYLIYDYKRLFDLFLNIFPDKEKSRLTDLFSKVAEVMGQYIRGNVLISIISAMTIFIGLSVIRIPFALPLAVFSGIMDLLPLVGSTIGAIPALFIAFSLSTTQGFSVIILYFVYQQIENAVISPIIYNKALKLYPALSFLTVVIGASLFGIVGAFLALPFAASIPVLIEYRQSYQNK